MPREIEGNMAGDVRRYLEGISFPALKHDVVHAARRNGAPNTVVAQLEQVPRSEFASLDELLRDWEGR